MYIKSRELLPVEKQVQVEGEDEGEDPRWELIRQLVEYKKFKDAAAQLQALEVARENTFPRLPIKPQFEEDKPAVKPEVSIFDLLNAVNSVLQRFTKRDDLRDIFEDKWTVSEKIELVMKSITERGRVTFSELFVQAASRSEVVCTFLALLELIRMKQLVCAQAEPFAEIEITKSQNNEAYASSPLPQGAPVVTTEAVYKEEADKTVEAGHESVAPESPAGQDSAPQSV
jgi:segregation and condensation protein A